MFFRGAEVHGRRGVGVEICLLSSNRQGLRGRSHHVFFACGSREKTLFWPHIVAFGDNVGPETEKLGAHGRAPLLLPKAKRQTKDTTA